jgi:PAS domain S-box-containing protein
MVPFSASLRTKYWVYGISLALLLLIEATIFWTPVSIGSLSGMLAAVYLVIQLRPVRVPISRFSALPLSVLDISLVMIAGYGFSLLVLALQSLASLVIEPRRFKRSLVRYLEKGSVFGLVPLADLLFVSMGVSDALLVFAVSMTYHIGHHLLMFIRIRFLKGVRYSTYSRMWAYAQVFELLYSYLAALFLLQLQRELSVGNLLVLLVAVVLFGNLYRMHIGRMKKQITFAEQTIRERFVFNSIDYAILAIDLNRIITVFNKRAQEIFKLDLDQVVGKRYEEVFNPFFAEQDRRLLHTLRDGVSYNLRAHPISVLGETYFVDIHTTPLKNDEGRMAGAVGVYRDVTQQKLLEQEMQQKDKLSLIGQMAAGTMHEIRNPLAIAKGHLELAFSKLHKRNEAPDTITDTELIRHIEIIRAQLERANHTLNRLLALAKPAETNISRVDIQELIDDAVGWAYHAAAANGIRLTGHEYREEIYVEVDPGQIKQVLINLLYNAFDATPQGGAVDVWAHVDEPKRSVAIVVADTGKGMSQEELEKIGRPFFTTKPSGTGLGLLISTQIVESHGGQLQISSEIGKGTQFAIRLPLPSSWR